MSFTFDQPTESRSAPPVADAGGSVDKVFAISNHCRLSLDNPCGRVRVVGSSESQVELHATRRGHPGSPRYQATRVETYQEGDTVYVRTVLDPSAVFAERGALGRITADVLRTFGELVPLNNRPCDVEYEVRVPRRADVDLKGVSSSITLQGVEGGLRARSVSGTITADALAGDLDFGSVSGKIRAHDVVGRLAIESVSGSIEASGRLGAMRAKTVSGAMTIAGPLDTNGTYDFHSVSGSVTLRIPESTGATVSVRGTSSGVSCDLPCQVTRNDRRPGTHKWEGIVNGGGAAVRFQSVSGNLRIGPLILGANPAESPALPEMTAAEPTALPPVSAIAASEAPTVSPDEPADDNSATMRILKELEHGNLSVDEALRRLESSRANGGEQ